MLKRFVTTSLCLSLIFIAPAIFADESPWEETIRGFEQRDAKDSPQTGEILFIGSSSIVMWKTAQAFPELKVINRGFGGSQIADSIEFAHRIAIPYKPRIVVFYAGDNDIAAGKSAERVFADYKTFTKIIHDALPKTRIVFVAIKPSIARWNLVDTMRKANALIQKHTEGNSLLDFVDIDTPMIGAGGKPRPELFVRDGLHLSAKGYEIWNAQIRPYLDAGGKR